MSGVKLTGRTRTVTLSTTFASNATVVYYNYKTASFYSGPTYYLGVGWIADFSSFGPFTPFISWTDFIGSGPSHKNLTFGVHFAGDADIASFDTLAATITLTADDPGGTAAQYADLSRYTVTGFSWAATLSYTYELTEAIDDNGSLSEYIAPGSTVTGTATVAITGVGSNSGSSTFAPSVYTLETVPYHQNFTVAAQSSNLSGIGVKAGADAVWNSNATIVASGCSYSLTWNFSGPGIQNPGSVSASVAYANISTSSGAVNAPSSCEAILLNATYTYDPKGIVHFEVNPRRMADSCPDALNITLNGLVNLTGVVGHTTQDEPYGGLSINGYFEDSYAYGYGTSTSSSFYVWEDGAQPSTAPTADIVSAWTHGPISIITTTVRLTGQGDGAESFDFRYQLSKGGISVYQDATTDLAGGAVTWATGSGNDQWAASGTGCTAAVTSTTLQVHFATRPNYVSDGFGFGTANVLLQHRRIRIKYRSVGSANQTFTFQVNVGGAGYSLNKDMVTGADGAWVEGTIDAFDNINSYTYSPVDIETIIQGFVITNTVATGSGWNLEVQHITSERINESLVESLNPVPRSIGTSNGVCLGHTDGLYTLDPGGSTLADLVAAYNGTGAKQSWHISAVLAAVASLGTGALGEAIWPFDAFYDASSDLRNLYAGGILYDNSLYGDATAQDSSHPAVIVSCPVFYQLSLLPGAGNWQEQGSYDTTIKVVAHAIFGSELCGQLLPAKSGKVSVVRSSDSAAGGDDSGRVTPGGWYTTGSPFMQAVGVTHPNYNASIDGFKLGFYHHLDTYYTSQPIVINPTQRQRVYVRWWGRGNSYPDTLHNPHWCYYAQSRIETNQVQFRRTDSIVPASAGDWIIGWLKAYFDDTYSVEGVALCKDAIGDLLIAFTRTGGGGTDGIYQVRSTDEGATWEEVSSVMIPSGQYPRYGRSLDDFLAIHILAAVIPGTGGSPATIMGERIKGNGEPDTTYGTWTFQYSGGDLTVENQPFDIVQAHDVAGRWLLTCVFQGETDYSDWVSSDECVSFTRLSD